MTPALESFNAVWDGGESDQVVIQHAGKEYKFGAGDVTMGQIHHHLLEVLSVEEYYMALIFERRAKRGSGNETVCLSYTIKDGVLRNIPVRFGRLDALGMNTIEIVTVADLSSTTFEKLALMHEC